MLRKEHKKRYQAEKIEEDRLERKNYRKNKSRERTRPDDFDRSEPDDLEKE